jgi:hypothetical protein
VTKIGEQDVSDLRCGIPAVVESCMYTAYLDGSGGGHKDVFVLGGYIASNEAWALLSDEWRLLLEREPRLDSFKMSYMAQTDARMKRAEEFYRIIEKNVAGYVACVIYTDEMLKAESSITWPPNYINQHVARNPYFSAFHSIFRNLIEHQHELGIEEQIQLVFDTQSEMEIALASHDYLILSTPPKLHHLLSTPRFEDDKTTPPLQAADLYAWWVRKWAIEQLLSREENFAWQRSRKIRGILIEMDGQHFASLFARMLSDSTSIENAQELLERED